jgi:uncharacterized protein (UPF0218 family)
MPSYTVTAQVLSKFQEPFGTLIEGSFSEAVTKLQQLIEKEHPTKIIVVGDTVTENLHARQVKADIVVTDNKTLRQEVEPQRFRDRKVIHVQNPQGLITQQAIEAILCALESKKPIHMLVEGEEDLLTLPMVLFAPEGAFVLYGQPHRGIVAVKVTSKKRAEAQEIWNKLEKVED